MKFSIRDLFLVTVIVALGLVAVLAQLDRQRLGKENGQLREELKKLKDYVGEVPHFTDTGVVPTGTLAPAGTYGPPTSAPDSRTPAISFPRGSGMPPSSFGNQPNTNPPSFGD